MPLTKRNRNDSLDRKGIVMKQKTGRLAAVLLLFLLLRLTACGQTNQQTQTGAEAGTVSAEQSDVKAEPLSVGELGWGAIVSFGSYEQDNDLNNGKEPIEWMVLDVQEDRGRVLLVSRQILEDMAFDESDDHLWNESSLRTWLNDSFFKEAFTESEQTSVQLSQLETPGESVHDTELVPTTEDRVFLLSIQEVEQYFGLAWGSTAHFYDNDIKAQPTAYALSKGMETKNQRACWYLRSSGWMGDRLFSGVSEDGGITSVTDVGPVKGKVRGVRPAVWVDLDADMTLLRRPSSDLDIGLDELLPTDWAGRYVVKEETHTGPDYSVVHVYCKMAYESLGTDLRDQSRLFSVYYLEGDDMVLPESVTLGTYDSVPVELVTRPDVPSFASDAVAAEYANMACDLTFVMDTLEDRVAELDHFQQVEKFGFDRSLYFPPDVSDFATGIYQLDCGLWTEESMNTLLTEYNHTSYLSVAPDGTAFLSQGSRAPRKATLWAAADPELLPEGEPGAVLWFEDDGIVKPVQCYEQMTIAIQNMEKVELKANGSGEAETTDWDYGWVSSDFWMEEYMQDGIG